jgi:DNA topoisomerase IA
VSSHANIYQMEESMQCICSGQSTRAQVVRASLEMYQEMYAKTEQHMDILVEVMLAVLIKSTF